ncbi:MAG: prealbumin-like fold domain-containing protein, partial [Oscillospiraceae bacterium]
YTLNWKNYPHSGAINITKQDAVRTNILLTGAEYGLFAASAHSPNDTPLATAVTQNGSLTFDKLPLPVTATAKYNTAPVLGDITYYLREINPPIGYIKDTGEHSITLTAAEQTKAITLTNEPVKADLEYMVMNNLTGALHLPITKDEFTLTDITDNNNPIVRKLAGNRRGQVVAQNLPFGTYDLVQNQTQIYHSFDQNLHYTVDILPDATIKIYPKDFPNEPIPNNEVINNVLTNNVIANVFEKNSIQPMPNVPVSIHIDINKNNALDAEDPKVTVVISDTLGKVEFKEMPLGETYFISEEVPNGFLPTSPVSVDLKPEINQDTGLPVNPIEPIELPRPQTPISHHGGSHGKPYQPPDNSSSSVTKPTQTTEPLPVQSPTEQDVDTEISGDLIPATGQNKKLMLILGGGGTILLIVGFRTYRRKENQDDK